MAAEKALRVMIAGGGIGGLAAAVGLRRKGFDNVMVFERAPDWSHIQVGFGIELQSNAMRALRELGLDQDIVAAGTVMKRVVIRSPRGEFLGEFPHGEAQQIYGFPDIRISRPDLHRVLQSTVPDDSVRLGAKVTGFTQDDSGVTLAFEGGQEERGDVLIGAEGVNSVVRTQIHGKSDPIYQGYPWWRGYYHSSHPQVELGIGTMYWGSGGCFAAYPVNENLVSWFCCRRSPLSDEVNKTELLEFFGSWGPARDLIGGTDEPTISRTNLVDRDPLDHWGEGRVTLLGDAAHPMVPTITQGAAQALEDAVVLSRYLDTVADPVAALRAYEAQRIPRTTEIVNRARSTGKMLTEDSVLSRLRERFLVYGGHRILRRQYLKQMSVAGI